MTPTNSPDPVFTGPLVAAASSAVKVSAHAYLDGVDRAVGLQRQFVRGTPLEGLTELVAAHAGVTRRLVEGYVDVATPAPAAPVEAARTADATAARLTSGTAEAATKATRRTARAVTRTAKRAKRTGASAAKATPASARPTASTSQPPITGYDGLTAEQLIAKLPELSQSDLVAVQRYERAQGSRSTVLERVEGLQGAEPAPGYDELNADDVQKLVAGGPPELAAGVRDYERRHKSRASVLEAAERALEAS